MALHHAVTWQEGSFERTASILSFYTRAARDAFRKQCPQRFEPITYKRKQELLREGRYQRLMSI